jgi:hypothetical protein
MKFRLLLALLLVMGLSMPAFAEVGEVLAVAEFSEGNVDNVPDGYVGDLGSGWAAAWEEIGWVNGSATVETAGTPLYTGGGNYLTYGTSNSGGKMGVARDYSGPDFDPLSPYTITFSYRLDDGLEEALATDISTMDRVQFVGAPFGVNSTSASSSFIVGAYGTNYGLWTGGPYWLLFDGTNDGVWDSTRLVNSGIAIAEDTVYDFTIDVNPTNRTYTATIVGNGSSFTTSSALGWRGDSSTYATDTYSYMSVTSRTSTSGHAISSSFDGLTITQDLPDLGQLPEVVANFDTDTYPDTAGNGWKGGWTEREYSGSTVTASVVSGNEVHSGDLNCLAATISGGNGSVARSYRARPGINYKEDVLVEFTIRIDETDLESNMTAYTDRYVITDSLAQDVTTRGENTFCIWSIGDDDGTWGSPDYVREWCFINGDQAGGITSIVDSDIDIVSGGVYDFAVTLNVDEQTYDVTVTDGTTTKTFTDIGWRTGANDIGGVLNFIGRASTAGSTRAMSIDNIRLTTVPEPSTFVLLISSALLGLLIWRRK